MFARTSRLLLRPGWIEDASALHAAIADEAVVTMLSRAPWPYAIGDAEAFLRLPPDRAGLPRLLVFARGAGDPQLVGGMELMRDAEGAVELGYWIARAAWGRGYASEAGLAVLEMASTLRIAHIVAGHFIDNPASGRVLAKLGFERAGLTATRFCQARARFVPTTLYARDDGCRTAIAA